MHLHNCVGHLRCLILCSSVRSLAVDGMSQLLVSGSADATVAIWHVKSKKVLKAIKMGSSVARLKLHEDSTMVAVALDDFSIAVLDLETKRVVRKFPGYWHEI